jgi:hypothetical protein
VRLQPRRHTDVRIDAAIDEAQRPLRPEGVHAVVRRRVRVLLALLQPVPPRQLVRRGVLRLHRAVMLPAARQRHTQQQQHDDARDAEAAVAQHLGDFFPCDS